MGKVRGREGLVAGVCGRRRGGGEIFKVADRGATANVFK